MAIRTRVRVGFAALLLAAPSACDRVRAVPQREAADPATASSTPGTASVAPPVPDTARLLADARCRDRIAMLRTGETLPGAPELDAKRAELFARAKADGVVFVEEPIATGLTEEGKLRRQAILGAADPVKALFEAYPSLQRRKDLARQVLLTDGYLYAAAPGFAAALSALVRPEDLFLDREIWIERGTERIHAVRGSVEGAPAYVYDAGPLAKTRVKLFLFDRVTNDPKTLERPLHRDLAALQATLGFAEARVTALAADSLAAELRYGPTWVPTLLGSTGTSLSLRCEIVPDGKDREVAAARALARRRDAALERLRSVIDQEVEEALPFDEPKTEIGQQDGKLRQHWNWAYRYGRTQFEFNEDRYHVFDWRGRPRVPQVCIDFVTDTFERAGGSWFRGLGEPRERTQGRVSFTALGIENERSVEQFIGFAKAHPEWFDVVELPDEVRVPYAKRDAFFADLTRNRERYQPGDVVTIYGLRADGKMHHHSFIVYAADPQTGMPSLVAANAGRPRVRPFEGEMQSAPLRSIRARIRPLVPWLEFVTSGGGGGTGAPPSASVTAARPATI
ncbi:MAG TPA: hypothetical protein VHE30_05420 [Polyangiaceae bacterium]|nr:hypothetical protein [Polyangiaceae bacterium]